MMVKYFTPEKFKEFEAALKEFVLRAPSFPEERELAHTLGTLMYDLEFHIKYPEGYEDHSSNS